MGLHEVVAIHVEKAFVVEELFALERANASATIAFDCEILATRCLPVRVLAIGQQTGSERYHGLAGFLLADLTTCRPCELYQYGKSE